MAEELSPPDLAHLEKRIAEAALDGDLAHGSQITVEEFRMALDEIYRLRGIDPPAPEHSEEEMAIEHLSVIHSMDLMRLLREIDPITLALALYQADSALQRFILRHLPTNRQDDLEEELQILHLRRVLRSDVLAAQREVIRLARKLDATGEIKLAPQERASWSHRAPEIVSS